MKEKKCETCSSSFKGPGSFCDAACWFSFDEEISIKEVLINMKRKLQTKLEKMILKIAKNHLQ